MCKYFSIITCSKPKILILNELHFLQMNKWFARSVSVHHLCISVKFWKLLRHSSQKVCGGIFTVKNKWAHVSPGQELRIHFQVNI